MTPDRDVVREELLLRLLSWIVLVSPYDSPAELPEIQFLPRHEFVQQICQGNTLCTAQGTYKDGTGRIVLDAALREQNTPLADSVLVHELVHYLQDLSHRWRDASCHSWVEREREAYRLQARYLKANGAGHGFRAPLLTSRLCDPPSPSSGAAS